ncbi:hypothetical protein BST61_g1596 [Cercospora zeina]
MEPNPELTDKTAESSEKPQATLFGPGETPKIFAGKWLHKFHAHFQTWPGYNLPWSTEDRPEWCSVGYDLVVAFEAAAASFGLPRGPEEDMIDLFYPWQGTYQDPYSAARYMKGEICTQVEDWTEDTGRTLPRLPRELVQQINKFLDKVTLGEISGEWKPRTFQAEHQQLLDYMQEIGQSQIRDRMWPFVRDEVFRRVGPDASSTVLSKTFTTVLLEKQRSGEYLEMLAKVFEQLGREQE